jgi:hypothetical protein
VEFAGGRSPLSEDELRAMPVDDAAQQIAEWRPSRTEWLVSARELGRTFEAVVESDPIPWASAPMKIVGLLHHPTYIHHYFRGLATTESLAGISVDGALDAIVLIRAHPWKPIPIGKDDFDFDADWRGAEGASVDLIKSLADSDAGFDGRRDEVPIMADSEAADGPLLLTLGEADRLSIGRTLKYSLVSSGADSRSEQRLAAGWSR